MLTAKLRSKVSWPNKATMDGSVEMNYLADVDPWLVHMTFAVAEARDDFEIERTALMRVGSQVDLAKWLNVEGAPFRLAVGSEFVRMRITDPENGAWCDFDVPRKEMVKFLRATIDRVDYQAERAALDAYIETGLEKLG